MDAVNSHWMLAVFDWEIRGEKNRIFSGKNTPVATLQQGRIPYLPRPYSDALDVALDSTFQINGNVPHA